MLQDPNVLSSQGADKPGDLKVIVEGFAAILAVLEHVADLSWVVLVHRLIHRSSECSLLEWVGSGRLAGNTLEDEHSARAARNLHRFAQLGFSMSNSLGAIQCNL